MTENDGWNIVQLARVPPETHYRQVSNLSRNLVSNKIVDHFWCSWGTACRRCSNYIFILDLTPGFIGLGRQRQPQDETRNI